MKMKLIILMAMGLTTSAFALDAAKAKTAYVKNGCQECHAVPSAKIARGKGDVASDLPRKDQKRDVNWNISYLDRKELGVDGKKHPRKFTGTDDEKKGISEWLVSLQK